MNIKATVAKIDKRKAAKKITYYATGIAVGGALKTVIANNVRQSENPVINLGVKASVLIGGTVAVGYVMKHLSEYSDAEIDAIFDKLNGLASPTNENPDIIAGTVE